MARPTTADVARTGWFDRSGLATGLPVGPLLVVVGYAVLRGAEVTLTDPLLVGLVVWPVVPALLAAAVLAGHRRWWLSVALGTVAGTVLTVVVVVGVITGLAALLSDPAGRP